MGNKVDLREYLFRKRMSVVEFSQKINYSRNHVSEIMNGTKKAGRKLANIIEKETNGEVMAHEVMNVKKNEDSEDGSSK